MDTFNSKDMAAWSETLNYPHVRLASGKVSVWDTKEDYAAVDIFDRLEASGWHHSAWVSRGDNFSFRKQGPYINSLSKIR